jgi:hypothetical protein
MLAISLEGESAGNGCLVGKGVDIEAEVVVGEEEACFQP